MGSDSFFGKNLIGQEPWARRGEAQTAAAVAVSGALPVGVITAYYGTSAPTGWLVCDGSSFSAVTYPALNTLLGGTTLPDLRRAFPMGKAASGTGSTLGGTGGSKDAIAVSHGHSLTDGGHNHSQNAHGHSVSDPGHAHSPTGVGSDDWAIRSAGASNGLVSSPLEKVTFTTMVASATGVGVVDTTATNIAAATGATVATAGSSGTDANLPPWVAISYIIKAS